MKLADYLEAESLTDDEFGRRVGLSQPQVSRLKRGMSWVSKETAARIRTATNGAVTADDFLPPLPQEAAE